MAQQLRVGALAFVLVAASAADASAQPTPEPPAEAAVVSATATDAPTAHYGGALRARWVSVPGWFLGLFTKENVPLSSYGLGAEFFRRKGDMDLVLGFTYQKMGPPDGNWLGKGKSAALDTDFVQFRDFALLAVDASFIWRQELSRYFGLRYGAGLGLAIVTGELLRVSNAFCTEQNAGNERECRPSYCPPEGCKESDHVMRATGPDGGPGNPRRFKDQNVPGAIPVLSMLIGAEFRHPELPGFEMRLEGGFYDAFFLGLGAGYVF